MNNKVNLLGLCLKSGNLISGTDLVIEQIRAKKVHLVVILNDSAENTIKKVTDKCKFYNVFKCRRNFSARPTNVMKIFYGGKIIITLCQVAAQLNIF